MAGISVSIVAGKDKNSSSVKVSGHYQHIITEEERIAFKLNDDQLKTAVQKSFGKRPDDVFVQSPTPWGDLYKRYNWPHVQTVLSATSAEIVSLTSEPKMLSTQEFENDSSEDVTYNASINDSVSNTTTSTWSTSNEIGFNQKIKYEVGFLGTGGGGETDFSYSHSWGEGGSESKQVTVGSSSGVSVTLKPGEKLKAELSASRGVMKVRIRYQARLIGDTAINYGDKYKGHHFWALDLPGVMSNSGVSNAIESTEVIEIGYFSNGKITTSNGETGDVVMCQHDLNEKCGDKEGRVTLGAMQKLNKGIVAMKNYIAKP